MKPQQRWLILGSLLLATLFAAYLVDNEPAPEKNRRKGGVATKTNASASSASRHREARDQAPEVAAAPLNFPEPAAADDAEAGQKIIDPFRNKSWYVAPPPPKPVKPTAPPLPFQYLGKLKEDGETRVFLNYQGRHIIAKAGDVIDGNYRVEDIAGGQMTFFYQPLKEKQVLPIGADN